MKKIFWLLPLLMWQSVVAQQAIYTIDVNGDILTNSQFIDPFFCEDQNTPYEQMYSETLPLPGFGKSCTITGVGPIPSRATFGSSTSRSTESGRYGWRVPTHGTSLRRN